MSIKTKIAAFALAALATAGTIASSSGQAQAKGPGPGFGIAAGIIGAAVVGRDGVGTHATKCAESTDPVLGGAHRNDCESG